MPRGWDRKRAFIAGALIGMAIAYLDWRNADDLAERIGGLFGGAVGGGIIFLLVAVVQNWIVRAR